MPTIRVDDDVYKWLQGQARPFEDSPNSVLRRIAALPELNAGHVPTEMPKRRKQAGTLSLVEERITGDQLAKRWGVSVRHALYHRDGTFYENLERFPGALFDPKGYMIFHTAQEYRKSMYLRIGEKLNVPGGISRIPGYMKAP